MAALRVPPRHPWARGPGRLAESTTWANSPTLDPWRIRRPAERRRRTPANWPVWCREVVRLPLLGAGAGNPPSQGRQICRPCGAARGRGGGDNGPVSTGTRVASVCARAGRTPSGWISVLASVGAGAVKGQICPLIPGARGRGGGRVVEDGARHAQVVEPRFPASGIFGDMPVLPPAALAAPVIGQHQRQVTLRAGRYMVCTKPLCTKWDGD